MYAVGAVKRAVDDGCKKINAVIIDGGGQVSDGIVIQSRQIRSTRGVKGLIDGRAKSCIFLILNHTRVRDQSVAPN